jgi:two-component system, NtrC family, response regulator GlrR
MPSDFSDSPTTLRLDAATGALRERTYRVTVVSGPDKGLSAEIHGKFAVGSHPDADLCLSDPTVSRRHLELEARSDGVRLRDLKSSNGTFTGGIRLTEALLAVEAPVNVALGQTELQLSLKERPVPSSRGARAFGDALGESEGMRRVFGILERVAPTDATVLLSGETGTGKEVLARAIHAGSRRRDLPFVVFDCAAVAPALIESELFGHVKGAFTGADSERKGAFLRAHRGTLFLDEIGELPLELQPRLLRALECGTVKRLGEDEPKRVDVRIVAATHRDLQDEVQEARFRQDLFFRLMVVAVHIPPLRDRPEDVPVLTQRFLQEMGGSAFRFSEDLLLRFRRHSWPGNVRELRNVVQRLLTGVEPELDELPEPVQAKPAKVRHGPIPAVGFKDAKEKFFEEFVRQYLGTLIPDCGGNLSEVARRAGIHRNYIQRLVDRYAIKVDRTQKR